MESPGRRGRDAVYAPNKSGRCCKGAWGGGGRRDAICVMNRGRAEAEGTAAKRRDCQVTEE